MPSKLKVDEIEVASASTVKLNSTLAVDTIKDASATNTLVEQSGSDWAWGSGVPSGSILQEKAFDEVASITAGSSSTPSSGNTVSFTKQESSSDSYIVYNWNGYIYKYPNAGSYVDHRMTWTPSGGSADDTGWRFFHYWDATGDYWPFNPQYYINSLNAGTHTFTMQARWGGGTNNNGSLVTDTDGYIFIREVAI